MTSPVQGDVAMAYSILDFAGRQQAKGQFQKYEWTNKCKLSVSISLGNFHGKLALKFEMTVVYELLLNTIIWSQRSSSDATFTNVNTRFSFERLKLLVKLIYENKLVKYFTGA